MTVNLCLLPYVLSFFVGHALSETLREKAQLIRPTSYRLIFLFYSNVEREEFSYNLHETLQFELRKRVDVLVLECTVENIKPQRLIYANRRDLEFNMFLDPPYLTLHMKDNSQFPAGPYKFAALLYNTIGSVGVGIHYTIVMDELTKSKSYMIRMALEPFYTTNDPSYARNVLITPRNVNAVCSISMLIKHDLGFHAYSVQQSQAGNGTISRMYTQDVPVGFLSLLLTQSSRSTRAFGNLSATVTAGRNYVGRYPERLSYVLDRFYATVKDYCKWRNITDTQDLFLHLHPRLKGSMSGHAGCITSMSFFVQRSKDTSAIRAIMARCIATHHVLTRRYPVDWSHYYIQLGLVEYYTVYWSSTDIPSEVAVRSNVAFSWDDSLRNSITIRKKLGQAEEGDFAAINVHRALHLFYMLICLLPVDTRWSVFDAVVNKFLAKSYPYNTVSFLKEFQRETESKVFLDNQKITEFFQLWMNQRHYPIVQITRKGSVLRFRQFSLWGNSTVPLMIPVTVMLEKDAVLQRNKTQPDFWLTTNQVKEYRCDITGTSKWFLVNNLRSGYYRVLYENWNYKLLRFELMRGDKNKISPISRGQLLDDAMAMGSSGYLDYGLVIEMLECLAKEVDEVTWRIVDDQLGRLLVNLRDTAAYPLIRHFVKLLVRRFYLKAVHSADDKSEVGLKWGCLAGMSECLEYTHAKFLDFLRERHIHEHMEEIVCRGVTVIDDETYGYIKSTLLNNVKSLEHDLYILAMVCTNNYRHLKESLNMIFRDTSEVAAWLTVKEKVQYVVAMCASTTNGATAVLDFIYQHPLLVHKNLGGTVSGVLTRLSQSLYKRGHQRKIIHLVRYLKLSETEQLFQNIKTKRMWLERNYLTISKILHNYWSANEFEDYVPF